MATSAKRYKAPIPPPARRERGSTTARGYGWDWQKVSMRYRKRHPVCEDCERAWSEEVHHKQKQRIHKDVRLSDDNLLALCKSCHEARTARGE